MKRPQEQAGEIFRLGDQIWNNWKLIEQELYQDILARAGEKITTSSLLVKRIFFMNAKETTADFSQCCVRFVCEKGALDKQSLCCV
jgi:hypothetical protein